MSLIQEIYERYKKDQGRFNKRYVGTLKPGSVKHKNFQYEKQELDKRWKSIEQKQYSEKNQRIAEKIVNIKSITNHSQCIQYLKEAKNYHSLQKK